MSETVFTADVIEFNFTPEKYAQSVLETVAQFPVNIKSNWQEIIHLWYSSLDDTSDPPIPSNTDTIRYRLTQAQNPAIATIEDARQILYSIGYFSGFYDGTATESDDQNAVDLPNQLKVILDIVAADGNVDNELVMSASKIQTDLNRNGGIQRTIVPVIPNNPPIITDVPFANKTIADVTLISGDQGGPATGPAFDVANQIGGYVLGSDLNLNQGSLPSSGYDYPKTIVTWGIVGNFLKAVPLLFKANSISGNLEIRVQARWYTNTGGVSPTDTQDFVDNYLYSMDVYQNVNAANYYSHTNLKFEITEGLMHPVGSFNILNSVYVPNTNNVYTPLLSKILNAHAFLPVLQRLVAGGNFLSDEPDDDGLEGNYRFDLHDEGADGYISDDSLLIFPVKICVADDGVYTNATNLTFQMNVRFRNTTQPVQGSGSGVLGYIQGGTVTFQDLDGVVLPATNLNGTSPILTDASGSYNAKFLSTPASTYVVCITGGTDLTTGVTNDIVIKAVVERDDLAPSQPTPIIATAITSIETCIAQRVYTETKLVKGRDLFKSELSEVSQEARIVTAGAFAVERTDLDPYKEDHAFFLRKSIEVQTLAKSFANSSTMPGLDAVESALCALAEEARENVTVFVFEGVISKHPSSTDVDLSDTTVVDTVASKFSIVETARVEAAGINTGAVLSAALTAAKSNVSNSIAAMESKTDVQSLLSVKQALVDVTSSKEEVYAETITASAATKATVNYRTNSASPPAAVFVQGGTFSSTTNVIIPTTALEFPGGVEPSLDSIIVADDIINGYSLTYNSVADADGWYGDYRRVPATTNWAGLQAGQTFDVMYQVKNPSTGDVTSVNQRYEVVDTSLPTIAWATGQLSNVDVLLSGTYPDDTTGVVVTTYEPYTNAGGTAIGYDVSGDSIPLPLQVGTYTRVYTANVGGTQYPSVTLTRTVHVKPNRPVLYVHPADGQASLVNGEYVLEPITQRWDYPNVSVTLYQPTINGWISGSVQELPVEVVGMGNYLEAYTSQVEGIFTLEYTASDDTGQFVRATRVVNVVEPPVDTSVPVITLTNSASVSYLPAVDPFPDLSATATKGATDRIRVRLSWVDGGNRTIVTPEYSLTAAGAAQVGAPVQLSATQFLSAIGNTTLTYTTTDSLLNAAIPVTRTIVVESLTNWPDSENYIFLGTANLSGLNFQNVNWSFKVRVEDSDFTNTDFTGATITAPDTSATYLNDPNLGQNFKNVTGANFTNTTLYGFSVKNQDLTGTTFEGATVIRGDFSTETNQPMASSVRNATFTHVDFTGRSWTGVDTSGTTFGVGVVNAPAVVVPGSVTDWNVGTNYSQSSNLITKTVESTGNEHVISNSFIRFNTGGMTGVKFTLNPSVQSYYTNRFLTVGLTHIGYTNYSTIPYHIRFGAQTLLSSTNVDGGYMLSKYMPGDVLEIRCLYDETTPVVQYVKNGCVLGTEAVPLAQLSEDMKVVVYMRKAGDSVSNIEWINTNDEVPITPEKMTNWHYQPTRRVFDPVTATLTSIVDEDISNALNWFEKPIYLSNLGVRFQVNPVSTDNKLSVGLFDRVSIPTNTTMDISLRFYSSDNSIYLRFGGINSQASTTWTSTDQFEIKYNYNNSTLEFLKNDVVFETRSVDATFLNKNYFVGLYMTKNGSQIFNLNLTSVYPVPVITLLGDASVSVTQGNSYTDAGAEVDDLSVAIIVGGDTVDVNTLGVYIITYDASNSFGDAVQKTRTVTVVAPSVPLITLIGDASVSVAQGGIYNELGAEADDLSAIVVGGDTVDVNTQGVYIVTYDASNLVGPAIQVTRTVTVGPPVPSFRPQTTNDPDLYVVNNGQGAGSYATENAARAQAEATNAIGFWQRNSGEYYVFPPGVGSSGPWHGPNNKPNATVANIWIQELIPTITLVGNASVSIVQGTSYSDSGASTDDGSTVIVGLDDLLLFERPLTSNSGEWDVSSAAWTFGIEGLSAPDNNQLGTVRSVLLKTAYRPTFDPSASQRLSIEVKHRDDDWVAIRAFGVDVMYNLQMSSVRFLQNENVSTQVTTAINMGGDINKFKLLWNTLQVQYDPPLSQGANATITCSFINEDEGVSDSTQLSIGTILNGDEVELGKMFMDPSPFFRNITIRRLNTGTIDAITPVDTRIIGTYTITYDASNNVGNAIQVTRTVTVTPIVTTTAVLSVPENSSGWSYDLSNLLVDGNIITTTITGEIPVSPPVDTNIPFAGKTVDDVTLLSGDPGGAFQGPAFDVANQIGGFVRGTAINPALQVDGNTFDWSDAIVTWGPASTFLKCVILRFYAHTTTGNLQIRVAGRMFINNVAPTDSQDFLDNYMQFMPTAGVVSGGYSHTNLTFQIAGGIEFIAAWDFSTAPVGLAIDNGDTLMLASYPAPDFDDPNATKQWTTDIVATSNSVASASVSVTIGLTNVDEPPQFGTSDPVVVSVSNNVIDNTVATVSAVDPDVNDTVIYSVQPIVTGFSMSGDHLVYDGSTQVIGLSSLTIAASNSYVVTVGAKTGGGNAFYLNGVEAPVLHLMAGGKYIFDQSDGTNSAHPLRFYEDENKTVPYNTGVTVVITGIYEIVTLVAPVVATTLYYQCQNHTGMGNSCDVSATPVSTLAVIVNVRPTPFTQTSITVNVDEDSTTFVCNLVTELYGGTSVSGWSLNNVLYDGISVASPPVALSVDATTGVVSFSSPPDYENSSHPNQVTAEVGLTVGGINIANTASLVVNVQDIAENTVQFNPATLSIDGNASGNATLTLAYSSSTDIDVYLAGSEVSVPASITFAAGETSKTFAVTSGHSLAHPDLVAYFPLTNDATEALSGTTPEANTGVTFSDYMVLGTNTGSMAVFNDSASITYSAALSNQIFSNVNTDDFTIIWDQVPLTGSTYDSLIAYDAVGKYPRLEVAYQRQYSNPGPSIFTHPAEAFNDSPGDNRNLSQDPAWSHNSGRRRIVMRVSRPSTSVDIDVRMQVYTTVTQAEQIDKTLNRTMSNMADLGTIIGQPVGDGYKIRLGNRISTETQAFTGRLAHVRIYKSCLSDVDLQSELFSFPQSFPVSASVSIASLGYGAQIGSTSTLAVTVQAP